MDRIKYSDLARWALRAAQRPSRQVAVRGENCKTLGHYYIAKKFQRILEFRKLLSARGIDTHRGTKFILRGAF